MTRVRELLNQHYQGRMNRLGARVTQRPVDATGRGLGYVVCEVAGVTGVRVTTGPDEVYYPGDTILVEQRGTAAAAQYVVLGWESGPRPDAGALEFTATTTIGNDEYGPGDLLWGNPFAAHFHLDYDGGLINLKVGSSLTGQIDAGRGLFVAGNPAGLHGAFGATGIEFRNGETVLSGWDAVGRTIYGIETLGRPHGPGIQQREFVDPGTGETRYAWQVLGLNGVPGVSFVTGSDTDPDDYKFYIGPAGASERLIYEDGSLTLTGSIHATSGRLGGWNITDQAIYTGTEDHNGYTANAGDITLWSDGTNASIHGRYFYLAADGTIHATGATIDGNITADSGTIAGLTVAAHTLTSGGLKLVIDEANERIRFGNVYFSPTEGIKGVSFPSNLPIDTDALTVEAQAYFNSSLSHTGTYLGFFGATATTRPSAYTFSNGESDKSIDCNATTLEELADVVYTMWNDLKKLGLLQ